MRDLTSSAISGAQRHTLADYLAAVEPMDVGAIHRQVREQILPQYPAATQRRLLQRYLRDANERPDGLPGWSREPWMAATKRLRATDARLSTAPYRLAFDTDEIELEASRCARKCRELMHGKPLVQGIEAASEFAVGKGIAPPEHRPPARTIEGCLRRLSDPVWWRRKLRRAAYRQTEAAERDCGFVHANADIYASDGAVERRVAEKRRARALLEETLAVNSDGEYLTLAEISDSTISNPVNRRAEMMTRLAGFEEFAKKREDAAHFLTLTLPSRFHARRRTGETNPAYDGSDPADGQAWLKRTWARIRAKLHRSGIQPYGFRIAEPHHDGTPYWHLLLFVEPADSAALLGTFEIYMLQESPDEPGAREHRFTYLDINIRTGSATGYLAKYVSKNIDGFDVGLDHEDPVNGRSAAETVVRVETWASTFGIRQFQQIGGPPVGVWRELRRVETAPPGPLEEAREAADRGDWCAFVELMGSGDVRLAREWVDEPSFYGDPIGFQTVGVEHAGALVATRTTMWTIVRHSDFATSRTCVNNCTAEHYRFRSIGRGNYLQGSYFQQHRQRP